MQNPTKRHRQQPDYATIQNKMHRRNAVKVVIHKVILFFISKIDDCIRKYMYNFI